MRRRRCHSHYAPLAAYFSLRFHDAAITADADSFRQLYTLRFRVLRHILPAPLPAQPSIDEICRHDAAAYLR
jgi:hypothetical protein